MDKNIFKSLIFTLSLLSGMQLSHSATLDSMTTHTVKPDIKPSLIAKAVSKQALKEGAMTYNVMMVNTLNAAPSQNFFAYQNQQFTRFVQALFHNSNT